MICLATAEFLRGTIEHMLLIQKTTMPTIRITKNILTRDAALNKSEILSDISTKLHQTVSEITSSFREGTSITGKEENP